MSRRGTERAALVQGQNAALGNDGDTFSVAADGNAGDGRRLFKYPAARHRPVDIPYPRGVVPGCRDHTLAVRAEGRGRDTGLVARKRRDPNAAGGIPYRDQTRVGAQENQSLVRAEHGIGRFLSVVEGIEEGARPGLVQTRCSVACGGHEQAIVGGEARPEHLRRARLDSQPLPVRGQIPHDRRPVVDVAEQGS